MRIDDKELREAQLNVERRERLNNFLNTKFAQEDYGILIAEIQQEARDAAVWSPTESSATAADVGMKTAFYSGVSWAVEEIAKRMKRWERDGAEAVAVLARVEKEKKAEVAQ